MKKETIKVYVVGGSWGSGYARFLSNYELVQKIGEAQIVILTGGADVDPSLYGAKKHPTTYCSRVRDDEEMAEIEMVRPDQLVVSICRGSQLSCVINGGLLVQNVSNHAIGMGHGIAATDAAYKFKSVEQEVYEITSTHHQMQYPYNLPREDYDILFTAFPRRSEFYQGDKIDPTPILKYGEPEIVLYHREGRPRFLAIQGHPEMIPQSIVSRMLENLIYEMLGMD
jgi:GMP synthase-like glutamine amidotransferase